MPLIQGKSPKAFEHNIKAEMHAGKPQDQSLAIAYAVKKRNAKKMASGGMVSMEHDRAEHSNAADQVPCMNCGGMYNPKLAASKMSEGGVVEDPSEHISTALDMDEAEEEFNEENEPKDSQVLNESGDPDDSLDEDMKKSRMLSRVLNSVARRHKGM